MVRFGIVLSVVLVAIGLLVTGVVAGSLLLVAISIGVALVAFLLLVAVVFSFRHEILGSGGAEGRRSGAPGVAAAVAPLPRPKKLADAPAVARRTAADGPQQPAAAAGQGAAASTSDGAAPSGGKSHRPAAAQEMTPRPAEAAPGEASSGEAGSGKASSGEGRPGATGQATPPEAGRTAEGSPGPDQVARDAEPSAADAPKDAAPAAPAGGTAAREPAPAGGTAAREPAPAQTDPADAVQVSVVPGITRYHRSDCQLIRFLSADDLEVMTRREATEGGCAPCKACKPDQEAANLTVG